MSDDPIIEQEWVYGPKVVDIGDIRVARGLTRRPPSSCRHRALNYDTRERRIWCKDCERTIDPFDAFTGIVGQFASAAADAARRLKNAEEAETRATRSIAARNLDKAWQKREMVPVCPHCQHGLFAEDFKDDRKLRMVGKDYARARAGRKALEASHD